MKKNIGTKDRIARLVIGVLLLAAIFFVASTVVKIILAVAGIFCFYEALSSWCAFYALIGRNTCPIE